MEPISATITAALALGASTALKELSAQAIKDAYAGLKELILRKYKQVPVAELEEHPSSKARRAVVEEELTAAGVDQDQEVIARAKEVISAVEQHAPEAAAAIGVDLVEVKAAALRIADVSASGTGVKVRQSEFSGSIEITGVQAGRPGSENAKKA
jgi:hypothetical protein